MTVKGRPGGRWVGEITGGEIGAGARPMQPQWVRELRDKSGARGVPFLFRQWGEWAPALAGAAGQGMIRVGKRAAGRLLDGRSLGPDTGYRADGLNAAAAGIYFG